MTIRLRHMVAGGAIAFVVAATPLAHAADIALKESGSTLLYPLFQSWIAGYKAVAPDIDLTAAPTGSSAGNQAAIAGSAAMGASDAYLSDEVAARHRNILDIPLAISAVAINYNLPGLNGANLKLDGPTIAAIYSGAVTTWDDPAIKEMNPGVTLPHHTIIPVRRADGSGTTFVFTDYLGMQSAEWKSKVGSSTSVAWPNGAGGKGSDGVAATVQHIPGGIGYDESAYATQNHLTTALMLNMAGKFVAADMESFAAAAKNADWSKVQNFAIDLNDQPGAESWPIESATFVLLPTDPKDPAQSGAVKKFFDWGFAHGSDIATSLLYIPLPESVHDAVRAAWKAEVPGTM